MIYVAGEGIAGEGGGVSVFTGPSPEESALVAHVPVHEMLYLAVDPTGRYLYGASGVAVGYIHVWRIGGPGAELTRVGVPVHSGGGEPCHLVVVDDGGQFLLVANYHGGGVGSVAVLPISPDGSVSTATAVSRSRPSGPVRERQGESHIHQVVLGPENEVLVVDLGADEVVSYLLVDGALVDPVVSHAPPGSGPRHLVRLPDGQVVLTGELDSTLLRARHVDRRVTDWQSTPSSALPQPGGANYPSDLRVGPGTSVVQVANRGADTVATMSITTGEILNETPCGAWPRHLALDGDRLYVSATRANRVVVLDVAHPAAEPGSLSVAGPMCVVIA